MKGGKNREVNALHVKNQKMEHSARMLPACEEEAKKAF